MTAHLGKLKAAIQEENTNTSVLKQELNELKEKVPRCFFAHSWA